MGIKLTAFTWMETIKALNHAQIKLNEELFLNNEVEGMLYRADVEGYLSEIGIDVSYEEMDELFRIANLGFEESEEAISRLAFYQNIHAYSIGANRKSSILEKLVRHFGVTDEDFEDMKKFEVRLDKYMEAADKHNCLTLYDAEQTYTQFFIDSITRQYQDLYNKERALILNTLQCYLTYASDFPDLEVQRCQAMGLKFGVKMVRGAYMNEERKLAEEAGTVSPICKDIQETHDTYNGVMLHFLNNLRERDILFVATHN